MRTHTNRQSSAPAVAAGKSPLLSRRTASPPSTHLPLSQHRFSQISLLSPTVQPKLTIGQPGDKYEQEADRVADRVMRMSEPKMQRVCSECAEKDQEKNRLQRKPLGQREVKQPEKEEDEEKKALPRKPLIQREMLPTKEEEEEEERPVQAKSQVNTTPNLSLALQEQISKKWPRHHPWPMYLQGIRNQTLKKIPRKLHVRFHIALDNWKNGRYRRNKGADAYKGMNKQKIINDLREFYQKAENGAFAQYLPDFEQAVNETLKGVE